MLQAQDTKHADNNLKLFILASVYVETFSRCCRIVPNVYRFVCLHILRRVSIILGAQACYFMFIHILRMYVQHVLK